MEDTSKTQGQTQIQPQPQAGGVGTVGTIVKEHEPPTTSQTESDVSKFVEPSGAEVEPKVHPELEKIGVRSVSESPQLDVHAQKAGVSHSGESVPVEPTGYAPITMTEEAARQTYKNAKLTDSIKWRAALIVKSFLKKMHGKLLTRKN